jgi:pimeloyl-ACP methyl ester carboxylesterase
MVDDLHELLLTLSASFDVTLPAVLAGWSYGGLVVELYATLYPDDVAGLVFIDPTPTERQPCLRIGGPWQRSMFALGSTQIVKTRLGEKLARRLVRYGTPDDVEPTLDFLRDRAAVRETRQALAPHARNRREIEAALAARGLPAVPLTVISAGIRPLAPRHVRLGRWMLDSHARLASRSPLGRTLVAERATHQIPAEQPQIIIDAIRAAIGASA